MARLPPARRDNIPQDQTSVFDEILKHSGSVPAHGPGSVLMHVPKARVFEKGLNDYLRKESCLPKKIQELAILVTAREFDCRHIWSAHAAAARKAGVPDAIVDSLRERKELPDLSADEAAVVRFGQEFFRWHQVSAATFALALEQLSRRGVVELGVLFGSYSMASLLANAFETDLAPNESEKALPI